MADAGDYPKCSGIGDGGRSLLDVRFGLGLGVRRSGRDEERIRMEE